ncbi:lysine--tRNA ligase, putative [Plasmodium relictum]|uniref:Lysyl-tRNA synthetase n=1 Tax=Plasmodium relictum TaxID=85471 RepID=A0A1J1HDA9_PLARL|nr:lysine--tRNA ligase, putative [Plasmodium relictum]CRH03969.1 lysine--tRNA ligase, putative [Plasmodium relictum]
MKKKKKIYLLLILFILLCNNSLCFKDNNKLKYFFILKQNNKIYKNSKHFILYNYGKEFFERIKKLNFLTNILKIDAYPSSFIKRNIKICDLKKKYNYLKNGEKDNDNYIIYGRVMVKRNNGMFLNIQDDEDNIQIYIDGDISIKKKTDENNDLKSKKCSLDNKNYDNNLISDKYINQENNNLYDESDKFKNINEVKARKIVEIGDFIAVKGFIRKTSRGEITLHTKELHILAKSLLPLPDKYKGMQDLEYKYRKRYLDFLTNKEQKEKIITRFKLIQEIRKYLLNRNYLEVDTPILQLIPGGATAKAFETYLKSLNLILYLRISPELYLKKLIISGISEKIFELSKCFRNEGLSSIHNPEFTLLEIYKSYSNYKYMIKFVEKLIKKISTKFNFISDYNIINKKWKKISFIKIIKKYTSINFLNLSFDEAYNEAKKLNITFDYDKNDLNWGLVVEEVFKRKVEPFLGNDPIHIFHLPSDTSSLAKTLNTNKKLSERFETYIGKMEIANGYTEEANPLMQEKKFIQQCVLKEKHMKQNINWNIKLDDNKNINKNNNQNNYFKELFNNDYKTKINKQNMKNQNYEIDYDYITALSHGLPPTGGLGIGIDRLCMLFTNSNSIKNILSFSIIKPN